MEEYRQSELEKIKVRFTTTGEGASDENYNPYVYRATIHGTNFAETTVHIIKACLGSGLLAIPRAFRRSGLLGGIILTIFVAAICTYSDHILNRNQFVLCQRLRVPYLSLPVTMKAAALIGPMPIARFANFFEFIIDFFIVIYQTGGCSVYIIFVSANFKAIMDRVLTRTLSIQIYMLYLFVPFLLMLAPPNLKVFAPISLLANFIEIIIFFFLLYHFISDLPPISTVKVFRSMMKLPLALGTIFFSTAAIGGVSSFEKSMKNPIQFSTACGALNIAMLIVTIIYVTMGFFGYWRYGNATLGSITLNLEETVIASVVQIMAMVTIYLSFGLNAYIPFEIIWSYIEYKFEENARKWTYNYILRLFFVIFAFVLAICIPLLDMCISFLGAFCLCPIQVMIPPVIDICINWSTSNFRRLHWTFIINIFLIIIAFITLLSGTYTSVLKIISKLKLLNDTLLN